MIADEPGDGVYFFRNRLRYNKDIKTKS